MTDIREFSKSVNLVVFLLIIAFAPVSWLNLNGILSEIPNMIDSLPEGWRVPSNLSFLIQIAQLVAMIYLGLKWLLPNHITHRRFIYTIITVNAVTCFLLSFFWNSTLDVIGAKRSFGLYVLTFTSALLTGSATICFLPYIAERFPKEYLFAYYIGDSFSALIPAVLALIQGVSSILKPVKVEPNFSVFNYFMVLFVITCLSTLVFVLIDNLPYVQQFWKEKTAIVAEEELEVCELDSGIGPNTEKAMLLMMNFLVAFFFFGFMPGIQSYSTLPYGNLVYSLSINLIFISIWSYKISISRLSLELAIALLLTIYIIVLSALSPCPFLVKHWFGSLLAVLAWFIAGFIYIRVRCIIATRLEKYGGNIFMTLGMVSLCGQSLGGLSIFLLVDTFRLFQEKPECVFDYAYCQL